MNSLLRWASVMSLVTLALPLAPVARAEPTMNGVYRARYDGGASSWRVGSSCNQSGCFAYVVSDQGWQRVAQLGARLWVMDWVGRSDGFVCPDGSTAPANVTWSWDAESLVGIVTATHGAVCGSPPLPPGSTESAFSLTRVG